MQSYSNHIRYYPPHHFVFYPFIGAAIAFSAYRAWEHPEQRAVWAAIAVLFFTCGWVAFMLRQHYALMVQNRVVRLETRLRYFEITGNRFDNIEAKLSFGQIAALRFASDEEFLPLLERTLAESLQSDDIKKQIKRWIPDHMRV